MSVPDPTTTEWVPLWGPALEVYEQPAEPIPAGTGAIWLDTDETSAGVPIVAYGTTLPASPTDGQEAILVDSITNPSYQWRFRYNAGSTSPYRWEFVGGTPASSYVQTLEGTQASSPADLPTPGPSFTVPRDGAYLLRFGANVDIGTTGGNNIAKMGPRLGALAPAVADELWQRNQDFVSCARDSEVASITAGSLIKLQYWVASSFTARWQSRWLEVLPRRVS